ncbi:MAG: DegV family protein [Chloroflexi bacterium]|nr:DegV family protein [Chloroflexota bacterium]
MIKIVADTLSCITVEEARLLDIPLLPQIIIFGEESYRDDTEINTETFLSKLKKAKELPKTAAPSPALYQPIFEKIIQAGDTPMVICPTSELSGTYRSAVVAAKEFPEVDIRIVDTRTLASGLGMIVRCAIQWANVGLSADEIEKRALEMASRERFYFMVATLEYLHKGGRLGNAQAIVGSVLQVKPILQLKNGIIENSGSQRTRKRALSYLCDLVNNECPHGQNAFLSVMHGAAPVDAAEMLARLRSITGIPSIPLYDLPAAILVHGGPGAFGVSFFVDGKE